MAVPWYIARATREILQAYRMTTFFVSRHSGAIEWARRKGLAVDRFVQHLDASSIAQDDVVIGTLPANLAAEVCARGATYLHLSLDLPEGARGRELSADDLDHFGARVERLFVEREVCADGCSLR